MLEFNFVSCRGPHIKSFLDAARFPNASTMDLKFSAFNMNMPFRHALRDAFPDVCGFAHLVHLKLGIQIQHWNQQPVDIPFFGLTKLRHLTLRAPDTFLGDFLPDGRILPALRTLTFMGSNRLEKDWVARFLGRLKDREHIPQITVTDCWWRETHRHAQSSPTGIPTTDSSDSESQIDNVSSDSTRDNLDSDSDSGSDDSNFSDSTEADHCSDGPASSNTFIQVTADDLVGLMS